MPEFYDSVLRAGCPNLWHTALFNGNCPGSSGPVHKGIFAILIMPKQHKNLSATTRGAQWNLSPPHKFFCEIYHLISSLCLQKSYHSNQEKGISKARGGGPQAAGHTPLNNMGGVTCPCPHSSDTRLATTLYNKMFHQFMLETSPLPDTA